MTDRAARMVEQKALNPALPGLEDVTDRLIATVFDAKPADGYQTEIGRGLQRILASQLMGLVTGSNMSQVRAIAAFKLKALQQRMSARGNVATLAQAERAHAQLLAADIQRFLDKPTDPATRILATPPAPPGAPIGDRGMDYLLGIVCDWK